MTDTSRTPFGSIQDMVPTDAEWIETANGRYENRSMTPSHTFKTYPEPRLTAASPLHSRDT